MGRRRECEYEKPLLPPLDRRAAGSSSPRYGDWHSSACQRLLNQLGRHHDRGNLVRFLVDPSIPSTNNAAERSLRPAVIARKVSQCSKNTDGADAFCAFKSVLMTAVKRGLPVQVLYHLASRSGGLQSAPL